MKIFRRFVAAAVLTMSLTIVALAGDIQAPGIISEPPPPPTSVTGDIQAPGIVAPDPVTEATLSLLQSLLSII